MFDRRTVVGSRDGTLAATLPPIGAACAQVADPDAPSEGDRTFVDAIISTAGACGIVLLVPFAMLLVGLPIALAVRGLVEAIAWLVAR
jgi:hypothetical protein